MSLFDVKTTEPKSDHRDVIVFAGALDSWAKALDDPSVEFSLMGLKLFENVNGFFPGGGPGSQEANQFLLDLNDFLLSWPS